MKKSPLSQSLDSLLAAGRCNASDFQLTQNEILERASCIEAATRSRGATDADAPPLVTRGERVEESLVLDNGQIFVVPARRGWGGECAIVDWVHFTVHESTFSWAGSGVVTDDQLILEASVQLSEIFGFGITARRETGAMFYKRSYVLGDGFGFVCHGGQRNTVLVTLSGSGCAAAREGWEERLYHWLGGAQQGRITRVDLAHDVYDGVAYSVDKAFTDYYTGNFRCGGRQPDVEQRGNWVKPNGKGRTLYVGHRTNGKFARVYEKGRQLGASSSEWVRVEVEFKSVDRDIPFDVLVKAGEYLAASYPAFAWIQERSSRIATVKKQTKTIYENAVANLRRQYGKYLFAIAHIEGSVAGAFERLAVAEVPARLVVPSHVGCAESLHEVEKEVVPVFDVEVGDLPEYCGSF